MLDFFDSVCYRHRGIGRRFQSSIAREGVVHIFADPAVERVEQGQVPLPHDWASRSLYLGEKGTYNWLKVVSEPSYPLGKNSDPYQLRPNRLDAIALIKPATFVSFGPGDGECDIELIKAIQLRRPDLEYVPIEIARRLLELTNYRLRNDVAMPFGIHGDFERGLTFLFDTLRDHANTPLLYSLLGGTVGNLDFDQKGFFSEMLGRLGPDDAFLLDVPLSGPAWTPADEPRLQLEAYSEIFREFLGGGVVAFDTDTTESEVVEEFAQRFKSSYEKETVKIGSDTMVVSNTIAVTDGYQGRTILRFRRFDWYVLLRWLEHLGFETLFARALLTSKDKFGMGVVLLKRHC